MPIAIPTRCTAAAERCNAHRDAILVLLKRAGIRLTATEIADAIEAPISEAGHALERLRRAHLVNVEHTPYQPLKFGVNAAAVL